MKGNLMSKIIQSAYLYDIFHVKLQQLPFLAVLAWLLTLGKIQDEGQDRDHCWWRHRPPAAPPTKLDWEEPYALNAEYLQTLTLFKIKTSHFITLFCETKDHFWWPF